MTLFVRKFWLSGLLFIILLATACTSSRTIVHGIDEREANEILVMLAKQDIPAAKMQEVQATGAGGPRVVLWDIVVSPVDALPAMALLAANGLPRKKSPNLLELFPAEGLVPSEMADKIRYQAGLANAMANTIRKIDGVVDANVILSFPEENVLNPNAALPPITASVYVKHTGILDNPNSQLISKIKQLVSSSISGLSYDNVTVIPDKATFSIPTTSFSQTGSRDYFQVWGFMIAKESLSQFRIFFFCVCLAVLILAFSIIFLFWKLYPLLNKRGGLKILFTKAPIPDEIEVAAPKVEEKQGAVEEKPHEEKPKEEPRIQENVEE